MKTHNKIEYRSEFTFDEEKRKLSGYCAVFERESNYLGFIEVLKRGCITDDLIKKSDVIFNYSHNDNDILARSKYGEGTLHLEVRDEGLYFEFEIPNTTLGNDVYESVKRGDLTECSFAFTLDSEDTAVQRWYKGDDGILHREINKIYELFDGCICPRGAYSDTSVSTRSFDAEQALKEIEERELQEKTEKLQENLSNKLNDFLTNISI